MSALGAAAEALRSLGTAGSLQAFATVKEHIEWLRTHMAEEDVQALLGQLVPAVCRGLFLMHLSPSMISTVVFNIADLCSITGKCAAVCSCKDVPAAQQQSDRLHVAQLVAKSELLPFLSQVCSVTGAQLRARGAAQPSTEQLQYLLALATGLLNLFACLAQIWPGKLFTGKTIAQTVQPAAILAAAVLDCLPLAASFGDSTHGSSSSSASRLEQLWGTASRGAVSVGNVLARAVDSELLNSVLADSTDPLLRPALQLLATPEVTKLLRLNVAAYAMLLHQQQQQLNVPPYHLQLFTALGMAGFGMNPLPSPIPAREVATAVKAVLANTWQAISSTSSSSTATSSTASSTSSSSTATSTAGSTSTAGPDGQAGPPQELLLLLLLTALEVPLLAVDAEVLFVSLQLTHVLIEQIYTAAGGIRLNVPPEQQQEISSQQMQAAGAGLCEVVAVIAAPVMRLAPVLEQLLLEDSSTGNNGQGQQQQQQQQQALANSCHEYVALVACITVTGAELGDSSLLSGLLQQQQRVACRKALELSIRLAGAEEHIPQLENLPVWQFCGMPTAAVRPHFALAVMGLLTAGAGALVAPTAATTAPQQQQQQVLSLLTSCVKFVMHLVLKLPTAVWGALQLITPLLVLLPGYLAASSADGSSSSSSRDVESFMLLEVLVARCLQTSGHILNRWCSAVDADAAAAVAAAAEALKALHFSLQSVLVEIAAATSWVCNQLQQQTKSAGAAAAHAAAHAADRADVLQDLVSQGRQLAEAVLRAKQQLGSSSDGSSVDGNGSDSGIDCSSFAAAAQLLRAEVVQQLQQFGAGVCAQLPSRHCCNHPACVNMAKASELELVGGKSCICAGCRVARYCGKDCQVAHWKAHKRVCKQLQAAAAALR